MARGDGVYRTSARNARMTAEKVGNAQRHNEREKESYTNQDIVPERTETNVHFKTPTAGYAEMFDQMVADGTISTRGLKADAEKFGELIFDVNSAYFYNPADTASQNNFTPMPTKAQSKSWAASNIFCRRSYTPMNATGQCPNRWARMSTTIIFMWSISLW